MGGVSLVLGQLGKYHLNSNDKVGNLVEEDTLIKYQLVISYGLLVRIFTYQPTVDKPIVLSTNC